MAEVFEDCIDEQKYKYKTIRGKTKYESKSEIYIIKEITIQNLIECYLQDIIIIPKFQRKLDENKVEEMIKTFNKDNESFNFLTNPIQIVYMSEYSKYLLIDGQNRLNMYKKLLDTHIINNNHEIRINIIRCNNHDKIYEIYTHFNSDIINSLKAKPEEVEQETNNIELILKKLKYDKFTNMISDNFKKYFHKNNENIYSLNTFIDILYENSYIELFDTINAAYEYLIDTNNIYCNKFYTIENCNDIKLNKE